MQSKVGYLIELLIDAIVNDHSKFQVIAESESKDHPILKEEEKIQRYVRTYIKEHVDNKEYSRLYPTGSQPGKLYGTCKTHKANNPLRPVVSMNGTSGYWLAKYLDRYIKRCMPNSFLLKSTDDFIDRINTYEFSDDDSLISFDVVSLFTNVPLQETIDIITKYVYADSNKRQPPFSQLIFKRMLKCATQGIFAYNGRLYKQIDGVIMGSPLGPTLANFFLGHMEKQLCANHDLLKPNLYVRFIDDIFSVFPANQDYRPFLNALNNYHPNIKFTVEIGGDRLCFLDTTVSIEDGKFETWVYRKPSNTGVVLNYSAICPKQWKIGLVKCFLSRAWTVCSTYQRLHEEIDKLKSIFTANGYPLQFVEGIINRFMHEKLDKSGTSHKAIDDDCEKRFILKVPYIGKPSIEFKRKITQLIRDMYKVNFNCVFVGYRLKNMFSLKCPSHPYLAANVVYKFSCRGDPTIFYIGESARHIGIRASEHLRITEGPLSAVGSHIKECDECRTHLQNGNITYRDFEIIKSGYNKFDIEVAEALLIKRHNPSLNKQLFRSGSSFTCRIFV